MTYEQEYQPGVISNCCGASITAETGYCSQCGEACEADEYPNDPDYHDDAEGEAAWAERPTPYDP